MSRYKSGDTIGGGKRIAIACGGTGGHLFPALAVAEAISKEASDTSVLLVGTRGHVDERLGLESYFETLVADAPRRPKSLLALPFFMIRLALSIAKIAKAFLRFKPDAVISAGGYASFPAAIAGKLTGAKLVLLEQNVIPGRTNRLLARFANEIHTQFAESIDYFKTNAEIYVSGNPVRESFTKAVQSGKKTNSSLTLLVTGGSQGAQSLNDALWGALGRLGAAIPDIRILHCAGDGMGKTASHKLYMNGISGGGWDFNDRMSNLYSSTDIVLSRAGATSISEMAVAGVPAILVPYPYAADNHQMANARVLKERGACDIIEHKELTPELLAEKLIALFTDTNRRNKMALSMRAFARQGAADVVAESILQLIGHEAQATDELEATPQIAATDVVAESKSRAA